MRTASELWARWRVRVGYPVAAASFYFARPTARFMIIGGAIVLLGLAVRTVAAGYLRKNSALATSGPYARTRNPLYFGSVLITIGFALACHSWIVAVMMGVYFAVFYTLAMQRESRALAVLHGAAFAEYAASVPIFWPSLRAARIGSESFSWGQYLRNREYRAPLYSIGAMALLWVLLHWRR